MQSIEGTCNNMGGGGSRKPNPTWSLPSLEKKRSYGARSEASPVSTTKDKIPFYRQPGNYEYMGKGRDSSHELVVL